MMVPDHEEARVFGFKGHLQNIVREASCIVLFLTLPGNLIIPSSAALPIYNSTKLFGSVGWQGWCCKTPAVEHMPWLIIPRSLVETCFSPSIDMLCNSVA